MTTARGEVLAVLTPLGHPIVDSRLPGQVNEVTFAVGTREVASQGTGRQRLWTLDVYVLTPLRESAPADDDLDAALAEVLDALDKATTLAWTSAERGTAAESFASFKITVTVILLEE